MPWSRARPRDRGGRARLPGPAPVVRPWRPRGRPSCQRRLRSAAAARRPIFPEARMFRLARCVSVALLCAGGSALGMPAAMAADGALLRLAHLSPDTPAVDVYVDSVADPDAGVVLPGVGYGTISDYQDVAPGTYTVAMRAAGDDPATPPVLSTTVEVGADTARTVAGVGYFADLGLKVLEDDLALPPPGQARMRVVAAAAAASTHRRLARGRARPRERPRVRRPRRNTSTSRPGGRSPGDTRGRRGDRTAARGRGGVGLQRPGPRPARRRTGPADRAGRRRPGRRPRRRCRDRRRRHRPGPPARSAQPGSPHSGSPRSRRRR